MSMEINKFKDNLNKSVMRVSRSYHHNNDLDTDLIDDLIGSMGIEFDYVQPTFETRIGDGWYNLYFGI